MRCLFTLTLPALALRWTVTSRRLFDDSARACIVTRHGPQTVTAIITTGNNHTNYFAMLEGLSCGQLVHEVRLSLKYRTP